MGKKHKIINISESGITITVGIGENKVRAKIANKLAKNIDYSAGIFDLARTRNENNYLKRISVDKIWGCLLYTSPSPRDIVGSRMPSSA